MTTDIPALRRADWERSVADRTPPRAEAAAQRLASMAAEHEPGQRLGTKDELRALCGVSVGTFNEALRIAHARGVVTVRPGPGGGLFASRQSPMVRLGNSVLALDGEGASVADAVRLRDALDPLLIEDALQHTTTDDVVAMNEILARMKAAAQDCDGIAFLHANWALHARIAEISPTPILRSLYLSLLEIIESHTLSVQPLDATSAEQYIYGRYELHADLVTAIAEGDRRALKVIREHNTSGAAIAPDHRS